MPFHPNTPSPHVYVHCASCTLLNTNKRRLHSYATAPHRTAPPPHCTAPHCISPHRTAALICMHARTHMHDALTSMSTRTCTQQEQFLQQLNVRSLDEAVARIKQAEHQANQLQLTADATYLLARMLARSTAHICACTHAHVHCAQTRPSLHTNAPCMHACMHPCIHARTNLRAHEHTHTCVHGHGISDSLWDHGHE